MGHREDLIAGAKQCLLEKGYAHTTARDIVAVSGTNLASIGYHFGSKDALMVKAMIQLMDEWGQRISPPALRDKDMPSAERFLGAWRRIVGHFTRERDLLIASFEIFAQIERVPELKAAMAEAYEGVRADFAYDFLSPDPELSGPTLRAVSSLLLALLSGLTAQYLADPERAPTAEEIVLGLRYIGKALG